MDSEDQEWARLAANLERLTPAVASKSEIHFNAGNIGVWIAVSCLGVSMTANLFLGFLYLDHARQIDDLEHYIQAIYQIASEIEKIAQEGKN